MKTWYLDHSGVAVETDNHVLVFDYFTDTPSGGDLTDGVVSCDKLPKNKQLCIFVSHDHHDHYNKIIYSWQKSRENTLIFLGDDISKQGNAITVSPDKPIKVDELRILALRSTDQGVAFIVETDGKTIYHAGDLNWWNWEGEQAEWLEQVARDYKQEIDKLKNIPIDLAFVPVDPRLEGSAGLAANYFMQSVDCKKLMPIHLWGDYDISAAFTADPKNADFADKILVVRHRGQMFEV